VNKRLKCVLAAELVALGFVLAFLPSAVEAWTSVHLSATVVCVEGYNRADVTAENSESEAAHVLAETGGAWVVGDDIPKPSQTKGVSISGPTTFQVTVNYPSDGTPLPSNSVTVNPIHGCEPTTTTSSTSTSTSSTSTSTTIPETTTTRPTTTTTEGCEDSNVHKCDHDTTTTSTIPSVTTVCTARDVGSACDTTTRPSTTVAPTAPQMPAAVPATPSFTG
jgi:hypothetical protein